MYIESDWRKVSLIRLSLGFAKRFFSEIIFHFLLSFSLNGTALDYCIKNQGWTDGITSTPKQRYSAKIYSICPGTSIYTGLGGDKKWAGAQLGQNSHFSSLQIKYDVQSLICVVFFFTIFLHACFLFCPIVGLRGSWKTRDLRKQRQEKLPSKESVIHESQPKRWHKQLKKFHAFSIMFS